MSDKILENPDTKFEYLSESYDNVKDFKIRYASKILKTFSNNKEHKFNKNTRDFSRINLSSTAICTYALTQYTDLWKENNSQVFGPDCFLQLNKYWSFIMDVLANRRRKPIKEIETPDEFSILNILPLLKKFQTKLNGKRSDEENDKDDLIILDIVELLCNQFALNKLSWEEKEIPHPFIYFKFLLILDDWEDKIIKRMLSKYQKFKGRGTKYQSKDEFAFLEQIDKEHKKVKQTIEESVKCVLDSFRDEIYASSKHELYRQMTLHSANDRTLFDVKRLVYSLLVISKRSRYSNSIIFKKALDTIFKEQLETGLLPICHVVNNDFVITKTKDKPPEITHMEVSASPILLSFECYNDMLSDENVSEGLKKHIDKLGLAITWAKSQLRKSPNNPEEFFGWIPEYECTHIPESWVSSHILIFFKKYCELLSKQLNNFASKYLGAKEIRTEILQICDSYNSVEHIELIKNPDLNYNSILLFGPPGTGKTTTGRYLAKELTWKYIELGPTVFLKNGESNVVATAEDVFKKLGRINEAVILFDEIDEPLKKRVDDKSSWTVTAFLPMLSNLRARKRIKFILATNDLTKIDDATYRPGRIDLVLPMGNISWRHRILILQKVLQQTNQTIQMESEEKIFGNYPKDKIIKLKKSKIRKDTPNYLCNFLKRTNYLSQRDIHNVLMNIFMKETYDQVTNDDRFKIFFDDIEGYENKYMLYKDKKLEEFQNQLCEKNSKISEKIRFPDETKDEMSKILEDNIFQ